MRTLEVKRDEVSETRICEGDDPAIGEGQALLRIERFGLTANNATYALIGDLLAYWSHFPGAEDGWGRVPAWGIAEVVESRSDELEVGTRLFGFVPMSTHLVIEPRSLAGGGIEDASAHRQELPAFYRMFNPAPEGHVNQTVILQPLFFTALVLDTAMAKHGAEQVVLSSASSRTATATAFFVAQRDVKLVGLTSERNAEWVRELGIYDSVLTYDEVDQIEQRRSVYIEFAGNGEVRDAVHERLGDELKHSAGVGITHQNPGGFAASEDLPGPAPEIFFAPDHKPDRDPLAAWGEYCTWVEGWLGFDERAGIDEAGEAWGCVLGGELGPGTATVIVLRDD
ncbi:DUF2855 family protein [soil metagenome]